MELRGIRFLLKAFGMPRVALDIAGIHDRNIPREVLPEEAGNLHIEDSVTEPDTPAVEAVAAARSPAHARRERQAVPGNRSSRRKPCNSFGSP